MINKLLSLIFVFFFLINFNLFSQDSFLSKIKSHKVKNFLKKENLTSKAEIKSLGSSCADSTDLNDFYKVSDTFIVNEPMRKVWNTYQKIPMNQAWNIKKAKFEFMFSPKSNKLLVKNEADGGLEEGQLCFLKLRLMGGLVSIVVANKLTLVDEENHCLEFCYLESGVTHGSQFVKFEDLGDGATKITHDTFYKSDSKFRDTKLYPSIHEKIIKQFHENIKNRI